MAQAAKLRANLQNAQARLAQATQNRPPLPWDSIKRLRQGFSETLRNNNATPQDKYAAGKLLNRLDDYLENTLPPSAWATGDYRVASQHIRLGNALFQNAKKQEVLDDLLKRIDLRGGNAETIRAQVLRVVEDDAAMMNFTQQEQDMLRELARSGGISKLLSGIGEARSMVLGGLGRTLAGGLVGWQVAGGNPLGAAIGAGIGYGSNVVANSLAKRGVRNLLETARPGNLLQTLTGNPQAPRVSAAGPQRNVPSDPGALRWGAGLGLGLNQQVRNGLMGV